MRGPAARGVVQAALGGHVSEQERPGWSVEVARHQPWPTAIQFARPSGQPHQLRVALPPLLEGTRGWRMHDIDGQMPALDVDHGANRAVPGSFPRIGRSSRAASMIGYRLMMTFELGLPPRAGKL